MTLTATELRANIYQILDRVLATGEPVDVVRNGRVVRLSPEPKPSRLERLQAHPEYLQCHADEIVHMDWSGEWQP